MLFVFSSRFVVQPPPICAQRLSLARLSRIRCPWWVVAWSLLSWMSWLLFFSVLPSSCPRVTVVLPFVSRLLSCQVWSLTVVVCLMFSPVACVCCRLSLISCINVRVVFFFVFLVFVVVAITLPLYAVNFVVTVGAVVSDP